MKLFAVIGNPITHSISPILHNKAMLDLGLECSYSRYELSNGSDIISKFKALSLSGANVTVPYKEFALNLSDKVCDTTKSIGSANTLVLKNQKIYAYNTDADGFFKSIKDFKGIKKALVIGAGGTAKAISCILNKNNIEVCILNRSKHRFSDFINFRCYDWTDFKSEQFDIVINTTSAGLKDDNLCAPIELLEQVLCDSKFAFDVIYGKKTPFLKLADKYNLTYKDGKDMLLFQAVLACNLFFNNAFDEEKIEKSMREVLNLKL
ncbi:shikimate dehydrogenase [Campylobacter pinnipediorum subsp. pinnipediorum]|uniref:Shikimate dehydrogenase (NADP(+)) n=1 Tax=Campylobacter pinnipediorum subsp. pinnipediorum TaxID=1660067 RepID=A0AAX0L8G4_9BACT|nr:shikimate dehydrogenase [Campylobacter pinnipediorum]OPA75872.1 shikimate dehydrogenase [Campylobacter pinnipediorum subsp. pinnipediorum]